MQTLKQNIWVYVFVFIFIIANAYLTYHQNIILFIVPFALAMIYIALFHFDYLFYILVFFTPLSVNIEEFNDGSIGLFIPTEPILFGMLVLIVLNHLFTKKFNSVIVYHPISIIIIIQLLWILFTTITSTLPLVSFKFLITKLWFFIPIYFYGILFFQKDEKNIKKFIWLFLTSMSIVVIYTLIRHAGFGFDEETGHWVMSPFFKDHTSYGAILALCYPLIFGMIKITKSPLGKLILYFLIILFGFAIVMSYTRAAWLSLLGAFLVYLLIIFKVKFKYLAIIGLTGLVYIATNWVQIQHLLEKNNAEHATENLDERIESMANVTSDASNLERINRWTAAYDLWKEKPILGWGPGTYAMVYGPFQRAQNLTIISTSSGTKGNAHSEYLGPLAEQGILGAILMLILVGLIIYYGIIVYISLPNENFNKTIVLVATLGLITYFAHGFLNNYLDTDKATVPVWGVTAYIVMLDLKYRRKAI